MRPRAGDALEVGLREACNEPTEPQPAGRRSSRRRRTSPGRGRASEPRTIGGRDGKAGRRQREETEGVHERMDASVTEAQPGRALVVDGEGLMCPRSTPR